MPRKAYTDRSSWTPLQIETVEQLIEMARGKRGGTNWAQYAAEIGHPISSIHSMAHYIRNRQVKERIRDANRILRQKAAKAREVARYQAAEPRSFPIDHRRCTSTAVLMRDVEIRARAENFFGDPPPGRSVLDKKRAGIVDPPVRLFGGSQRTVKPTLATAPWSEP